MKKYVTLTVLILVFSMLAVVVLADTDSISIGNHATLSVTSTPYNSSSRGWYVDVVGSLSYGNLPSEEEMPSYYKGVGVVLQSYGYYLQSDPNIANSNYYESSYKYWGDLSARVSPASHTNTLDINNPSGSTMIQAGARAIYYYNCSSSNYPSSNSCGYALAIDYVD